MHDLEIFLENNYKEKWERLNKEFREDTSEHGIISYSEEISDFLNRTVLDNIYDILLDNHYNNDSNLESIKMIKKDFEEL